MKYTKEQEEIINTDSDIKINANAGSGKTHSIIGYVKNKPEYTRILYLAYNKSIKEEAEEKFKKIIHCDVHVKTLHSLAYNKIIPKYGYKVENLDMKDYAKKLNEKNLKIVNYSLEYLNTFLSSDLDTIHEINFIKTLKSNKVIKEYRMFEPTVKIYADKLYKMMDSGEIPVTHDFYIKKYQLSKPRLDYDYICLDEAQDASDVMIALFVDQKCTKVIVGDTHQQIYSWRNAVNTLEKIDFKEYRLTNSFRFPENIANLARKVINYKCELLNDTYAKTFKISGKGTRPVVLSDCAIIARANMGLIIKALSDMNKGLFNGQKVYFEGGYSNYSIFTVKSLLSDIIALKDGNISKIKNKELKEVSYDGLVDFAKKTFQPQLVNAKKLIEAYKDQDIIKMFDKLEASIQKEREGATRIYTTVHKSKGMEYDHVIILNDFTSKSSMRRMLNDPNKPDFARISAVNEEINLLYVAITRSRGSIFIPQKIQDELNGIEDIDEKNEFYKKKHKFY